jgi:hypothetical protein
MIVMLFTSAGLAIVEKALVALVLRPSGSSLSG